MYQLHGPIPPCTSTKEGIVDSETEPTEPLPADVQAAIQTLCEQVPGFAAAVLRIAEAILGAADDTAPAENLERR